MKLSIYYSSIFSCFLYFSGLSGNYISIPFCLQEHKTSESITPQSKQYRELDASIPRYPIDPDDYTYELPRNYYDYR